MKIEDFNLRHLRAVAAAVRAGSISGAANAVGISQPAVTQAIARMETLIGTKLFDRSPSGVTPTDAAILLGARAEAAAQALADAFGAPRKGGIGAPAGAQEAITMAQVTALLALADAGTYSAAAEAVGISQPSLHRAVSDLETVCGTPLAERAGRKVALTKSGERVARAFRLANGELQAAVDELAVLEGRDQGTIRLGVDPGLVERIVPPALARFLVEHPPVTIDLTSAGDDGFERLREGRIDALLTVGEDSEPDGLSVEALAEDPLVIVARTGHPLQGSKPGLVRLASFGWAVAPAGAPAREAWERLFLDGGLYPPQASVTCASGSALVALAAKSDLLTLAPAALLSENGESGLVAIGEPLAARRSILLATRAGWAPSPAQATFLDELRGQAARARF